MKKTKGMTKRLTALFLAVTFLAGTLSAGMDVEAAGKTYHIFDGGYYITENINPDSWRDYWLADISEQNDGYLRGIPSQIYVCGHSSNTARSDDYGWEKFLLVPRMYFCEYSSHWVKLDESKFGGYRFRVVTDNKRESSWKTEKRVNFDFTLTVAAPFMKDDNENDGYDGKVLCTFTQDDFDKDGYCKKKVNLPVVKGMSFAFDKMYDDHMYEMYYESENKKDRVNISLLPVDEKAFVEYMLRRRDLPSWILSLLAGSTLTLRQGDNVKFPIYYDLDGGKNHKSNPDYYTIKQKIVLKNPSKKGYVFKKWQIKRPGNETRPDDPNSFLENGTIYKNSFGVACLKAVWEKEPDYYNVSYKLNGGKNNNSNEKVYSSKKGLKLKSPSKKGYSFKGWYYDSAFKNKVKNNTISKGTTGNVRVHAKWQKKTYTIKYVNAGKHKNPKKYTVTSKTIKLKSAKKAGYTFKGWYSDKKYTKKVTRIKKGSTGNRVLYAKWQKIKK